MMMTIQSQVGTVVLSLGAGRLDGADDGAATRAVRIVPFYSAEATRALENLKTLLRPSV
jgi:hypothetical protein